MSSPFESLSSIAKANLDAALKFASRAAEYTERLIKLQVQATTEMVNGNNENVQALLSKPDTVASLASWQSTYQANWEKALDSTRRYLAEVSKTQTEVAQLIGEQVTATNRNAVKNLEDFAKSAMEESEEALKAVEQPVKEKRVA